MNSERPAADPHTAEPHAAESGATRSHSAPGAAGTGGDVVIDVTSEAAPADSDMRAVVAPEHRTPADPPGRGASNPMLEPLAGPSPVVEVVKDMLRRGVLIAPVAIIIGAAIWGADGAASVLYGLAIVLLNLALSAAIIAWTGRISLAAMQAGALFGFLIRLGLVAVAVIVVADAAWVDMVALGITIIISHLGLLFWELRYISASLAYPGLKPGVAASTDVSKKETVLS